MNLDVDVKKMDAKQLSALVTEIKKRGLGEASHYNDDNFDVSKPLYGNEAPPIGLLGTSSGFSVSIDINRKSQILSEYNSLTQIIKTEKGYSIMKESENMDPSVMSALLTTNIDRKKILEDRAMQLLGLINQVLKSIVTIIYELKELDRNLSLYDKSKSADKSTAEAAELEIRRIFVDNVDAKKGGASMISLSRSATQPQGGPGFLDIVSVFYAIKNQEDVNKLNKNEMYKNILKARLSEYQDWRKLNEEDLRMRRGMLLQYLESQAASFEFYKKLVYQYLSYLSRYNMVTQDASKYSVSTKILDITESALLNVNLIAYKEVYVKNYEVEWKKLLGSRKMYVPVKATQNIRESKPITKDIKEENKEFIRKLLSKYGPKVIAAIGLEISFKEKQMFPESVSQVPPQYEGTLDVKFVPYAFSLYEWYLLKNALVALIDKTVFENVSDMSATSLEAIKNDLDHYLEEAKKARTKETPKTTGGFAILDIYASFKQDVSQIINPFAKRQKQTENFNAEKYEISYNNRFSKSTRHDALKVGLWISINDAKSAYEEYKSRFKFLNFFTPRYKFM